MRETDTLEFKRELTSSYLKTVSAFANYGTGKIIFGIDDDGKTVGIKDLTETCLRIENQINDAISPAPRFTLEPNTSQQTISLTVHEGLFKPYLYQGKAFRRNDSSTLPVDRLEYGRLILEGQNLTYDQLPSAEQDLQFEQLQEVLHEILGLEGLSDDVLRTLGLKTSESDFTNAAALLADKNTFKGIDIARFGDSINELRDRRNFDGASILTQMKEATRIYEQYYCMERIDEMSRKTIEQIPKEAYREALANALVHRTWDVDASIIIGMHPNRIEITSPGGLPPGMSEEDYLKNVSISRNPILANVFFRLKYIEQFGTGIARIIAAYQDAESNPSFEVRPNSIKVTLPLVDELPSMTPDEKVLYDLLGNGLILSRSELSKSSGFSKDKTIRVLNMLEGMGLVKKRGSGRATRYSR